MKSKKILYLFGSKSDLIHFEKVEKILNEQLVPYDVKILSAHRNLEELITFIKERSKDYSTIIAVAGFSAALPGLVASLSDVPVLGVPISSSPIKLDALYSMIEMPKGVPLAVCSYDKPGIINATLLSLRITGEKVLFEKFKKAVVK